MGGLKTYNEVSGYTILILHYLTYNKDHSGGCPLHPRPYTAFAKGCRCEHSGFIRLMIETCIAHHKEYSYRGSHSFDSHTHTMQARLHEVPCYRYYCDISSKGASILEKGGFRGGIV